MKVSFKEKEKHNGKLNKSELSKNDCNTDMKVFPSFAI